VVVIIGPSGSGKSTMLRTINGLETITTGELLINGTNIRSKETKLTEIRKNIGMVFQHFNFISCQIKLDNSSLHM
jgi:putative glutamine transport system ATP-binding protein